MYEFAVAPAVTKINRRGVEITDVAAQSLAHELELEAGDRIMKVNGRTVRDYLDFRYHTGGETALTINVIKGATGEEWEIDLERGEGEDFGLEFGQIVPRQCANDCLFCFCKGNPPDARPSLFIRDEDIRLSFLYGNYTTLTSVTEAEMSRIVEQHLSPQYVSVHATDVDVRARLLNIPRSRADISAKMRRLLDAGIELHAQVVLCPEINDGAVLEQTIRDLAKDYPRIKSVAVVPLGLTKYNDDPRLTHVTPEFCLRVIKQVGVLQKELRAKLGTTFAFLGDEIYLRAGLDVPGRKHYGDYPQIEDGVGMVRSFYEDFARLRRNLSRRLPARERMRKLHGTILTGTLFAPVLNSLIAPFNEHFGTRLSVLAVENRYFGGDATVAGLMTGADIIAMREQFIGEQVFMPQSALKSDDAVMLDGTTLEQLQRRLAVPVSVVDSSGLIRAIESSAN